MAPFQNAFRSGDERCSVDLKSNTLLRGAFYALSFIAKIGLKTGEKTRQFPALVLLTSVTIVSPRR